MQKFQGKYRVETARAKWWDYSNEGDYFITICTKNREHLFGYVKDEEMILNEYGQIVQAYYIKETNYTIAEEDLIPGIYFLKIENLLKCLSYSPIICFITLTTSSALGLLK